MKNMKLYISIILAVIIFVVTTGCASRPAQGEGWKDPNKPDDQEWSDPNKPDDQEWRDPSKPDDQEWSDPEKPDDQGWRDLGEPGDQEWRDPEKPWTEVIEPSEPDHTGMYKHEIDGIVFYTEHDVEQWIGHQDGLGMTFNLEQMVKDLFGDEALSGNNVARVVSYNGSSISLSFYNANMDGTTELQAKDGFYPLIQTEGTVIYDLGDGSPEYYKPYYFINGTYYCTDYEMIEIALYTCERWIAGEYYFWENFNSSSRLYIIDGNTPRNP